MRVSQEREGASERVLREGNGHQSAKGEARSVRKRDEAGQEEVLSYRNWHRQPRLRRRRDWIVYTCGRPRQPNLVLSIRTYRKPRGQREMKQMKGNGEE